MAGDLDIALMMPPVGTTRGKDAIALHVDDGAHESCM
jgi:hypothetical protein